MVKRIFLISLFILTPLFAGTQAMAQDVPDEYDFGMNPAEKNMPLDLYKMRMAIKEAVQDEAVEGEFYDFIMEVKTPYSVQDLFYACARAYGTVYDVGIGKARCMEFVDLYMQSIEGAREYLPHYVLE